MKFEICNDQIVADQLILSHLERAIATHPFKILDLLTSLILILNRPQKYFDPIVCLLLIFGGHNNKSCFFYLVLS